MFRVHKIELRPSASQAKYFSRCAGAMRFVYNSLVARWKSGEKYNRKRFQKHCSELRQATPWMQEVSSRATYEAADHFHRAAKRFFDSCKANASVRSWPPTFKRKYGKQSFCFTHSSQFSVTARNLRIQGWPEQIRMRENIRFVGAVKAVTIKLHAGKWFAFFRVEMEERPVVETAARKPSVGVDLGIAHLAVLSTGETVGNPQPLRRQLRLLRRRQRQASRKFVKGQKQSHRYKIASARVSRLHKKVRDQRNAAQHLFTSGLVKRFSRIVIEDLAVGNMSKNRKLARAITCSGCGQQLEKKPSLAARMFSCSGCGMVLCRDHNAAINLNNWQPDLTPPIRGSHETRAVGTVNRSRKAALGPSDGANIHPKGSLPDPQGLTVGIY